MRFFKQTLVGCADLRTCHRHICLTRRASKGKPTVVNRGLDFLQLSVMIHFSVPEEKLKQAQQTGLLCLLAVLCLLLIGARGYYIFLRQPSICMFWPEM